MKSRVYFIPVKEQDSVATVQAKLKKLIVQSGIFDFIQTQSQVVVKIHFGEEGNNGHVKPEYARVICEEIKQRKAQPILSDTNTLYRGQRMNSQDHLNLAARHGFTLEKTLARIDIPEDKKENVAEVLIQQRHIKVAKVIKIYLDADALIDVSHFKGHLMTGFGGALKNIGMGCASREGKLAQHSDVSPFVILKNCIGCGACELVCPVDAITIVNKKAQVDGEKCIGCASCIAACQYNAMEIPWEAGSSHMQERMIEYAKAVLDQKQGKAAFVNFALKITKECDCLAQDDPRISPDIGIFGSLDPVAIDKACYDTITKMCGKDIFKEVHPKRNGMTQLEYAQTLGLGKMDYELVTVKD
jgi:uncharacterized protein